MVLLTIGGRTLDFKKGPGNKKYAVNVDGKTVYFGDKRYEHFFDKIGLYRKLDHKDLKRRKAYRARHSKIKTKKGKLAYKVKFSPAYFSYHLLW